jgi:cytochrome b561
MALAGNERTYGIVAVTLHWLIAFALIGLFFVGKTMIDIDDQAQRTELYQMHKSMGFTVLVLSLLRLGWRLVNRRPPLPDGMALWERLAARLSHVAFYVFMIAIPVFGWVMVSSSRFAVSVPTKWFGLFEIPHLPFFDGMSREDKRWWNAWSGEMHDILAMMMMALLVMHVLAALKHHVWNRDDVLARMVPFLRRTP